MSVLYGEDALVRLGAAIELFVVET